MRYKIGLALLLAGIYMALLFIASRVTSDGGDLLLLSFLPAVIGFVVMLYGAKGENAAKSTDNSDNDTKE